MATLFYAADAGTPLAPAPPLPADCRIAVWQPRRDGLPFAPFASATNRAWWLLDRLGLFARDDFTAIAILRGDTLVHRLVVTPRWYRFAPMAQRDLQLGDLWTREDARGQGLAAIAIAEAHRRFAGDAGRIWYIVDEDNGASRRLIERIGYRLVGRGRRTAPLGLHPLGRFVLSEPA